VDIAIRWGKLKSSDLVARRLGETRQAIVASPAYLARHGTPRTLKDLERHARLGSNYPRNVRGWPVRSGRRVLQVPISGLANASDGEALRALVLAGVGLARLSLFHIQPDLDAHRLVPVLEQLNPRDLEPIHAVYVGRSERLPSRVTAVLDFLEAHAFPRKNAKARLAE
jgi:DNA-binding transcriptional LysR family regulator